MPYAVAVVVILALVGFLFVAVAREQPPGPADVAVAYEAALGRGDFGLVYDLSGSSLRDGLRREEFVAARRVSAHRSEPATGVEVDDVVAAHGTALVITRVAVPGGAARNNVVLERNAGGWVVVGRAPREPGEDAEGA